MKDKVEIRILKRSIRLQMQVLANVEAIDGLVDRIIKIEKGVKKK